MLELLRRFFFCATGGSEPSETRVGRLRDFLLTATTLLAIATICAWGGASVSVSVNVNVHVRGADHGMGVGVTVGN